MVGIEKGPLIIATGLYSIRPPKRQKEKKKSCKQNTGEKK